MKETYAETLRNKLFALETNLSCMLTRTTQSREVMAIHEAMTRSIEDLKAGLTDKAFNDAAFDHVMNVDDSYDKNRSGHMTLEEEDIEEDEEDKTTP